MFLFFVVVYTARGQKAADSASIYYYTILSPTSKADLPAAINFYRKRKKRSLATKDTATAIKAIRLIAIGTYNEGEIYESEQEVVEGIILMGDKSSIEYDNARVGFYTQLGMINRATLDYEEALRRYALALTFNPSPKERANLLNNIANVYKSKEAYEPSKQYLLKALRVADSIDNRTLQAVLLDNLGEVQQHLNEPKALHSLHKALRLRKQSNNLKHHYTSYMSLASYYSASDKDSSRYYVEQAIAMSDSLQNDWYKKDALTALLQLHVNPEVRDYVRLSDKFSTASQIEENKYAFRKWNYSKAEKQTAIVENEKQQVQLEKEAEQNKRILYQWFGVLLVFIAILLFFIYRLKHKRDQIKQVYTTENRISKKVHDEVANDLYGIMAKIQTAPNTNEALLDDLESIYNKTRDISKENGLIEMDKDFGTVLTELLQNYQSDTVNVITKNITTLNWSVIDDLKKITLYRILQELMTNMRKHSKATLVVITANQSGKKLEFTYTDNGIGCEIKKGNGLLNTENRIRSVHGTIIFDATISKGFTAKISL